MLAYSGTHACCLGTSTCTEPRGAEREGDEPLLLPRDVMLVPGLLWRMLLVPSRREGWQGGDG